MYPKQVTGFFKLQGTAASILPIHAGHLNETFHLANSEEGLPDYLLQRINHRLFSNVSGLMMNLWQITGHIKEYVDLNWQEFAGFETLTIISTWDNKLFHRDADGHYWRVSQFPKGFQLADSSMRGSGVLEAGRTYGKLLKILSGLPARTLTPSMPDHYHGHLLLERMRQHQTLKAETHSEAVSFLVERVLALADEMSIIERLKATKKLPVRMTHNDCCLENVFFDEALRGRGVMDLDTVTSGLVHYDFGRGIQSLTRGEDHINWEVIEPFVHGYLAETRNILTPMEIKYLSIAGATSCYFEGVRTLFAYLENQNNDKSDNLPKPLLEAKKHIERTGEFLEQRDRLDHLIDKVVSKGHQPLR